MNTERWLAEEINFMANSIRDAGIRLTCRRCGSDRCAIEIEDKFHHHLVLSGDESQHLLCSARERWGAAGIVSFENALLHAAAPIISNPVLFG